jgi:hypothetical protein
MEIMAKEPILAQGGLFRIEKKFLRCIARAICKESFSLTPRHGIAGNPLAVSLVPVLI